MIKMPIRRFREVLNCKEAADLLRVKPFTIRTYASQGVIPGKKLGNEWRFVKDDLLAWLKGLRVDVANLETALKGAKGFLQRLRSDRQFKEKVESLSSHEELMAFARQEGFAFTFQELKEVLNVKPDDVLANDREIKILRRAKRYQVYLKVSELNGQPVTDTAILDFSVWGARIGSLGPLDTNGTIEITLASPGESRNVHISGHVVWSKLIPVESQYHSGIEFSNPLDQLHREGKI
jgi:predicted ribosomally synthesized peptide with nif11-like leader